MLPSARPSVVRLFIRHTTTVAVAVGVSGVRSSVVVTGDKAVVSLILLPDSSS